MKEKLGNQDKETILSPPPLSNAHLRERHRIAILVYEMQKKLPGL